MSAQKKFMKIRSSRIFKQLDNSISQSKYLTHLNEIKKIAQPVNGYVYDKTCVPHDHLDCIQCHGLYNVSHPNQKNLDEDMQKLSGWDIHTHSILFEGVCLRCLHKKQNMNCPRKAIFAY